MVVLTHSLKEKGTFTELSASLPAASRCSGQQLSRHNPSLPCAGLSRKDACVYVGGHWHRLLHLPNLHALLILRGAGFGVSPSRTKQKANTTRFLMHFLVTTLVYALPQLFLSDLHVCVPHLEVLKTSLSLGMGCFDCASV